MDDRIKFKKDPLEKAIIKHVDDVSVSPNELNLPWVMNRNFIKLLENDAAIGGLTENVRNGIYRLMPYISGATYNKNDLVFFTSTYVLPMSVLEWQGEDGEGGVYGQFLSAARNLNCPVTEVEGYWEAWHKYHTTSLFLLRCTATGNSKTPELRWIDMVPRFDSSGWVNENPMGTIYTDYFPQYLEKLVDGQLWKMHESLPEYHKFGTLSSYAEMDTKILRTDMKNIDPDRKGFHFPGFTFTVPETNTILGGSGRKWDCGLLEYSIEFKLGTDAEVFDSYNEDGSVRRIDQIDVNYLNLERKAVILDDNLVYDNSDYYLDKEDADIFKIKDGQSKTVNNIVQVNTHQKINALQGSIKFPIPFIDTNYAIFCQTPPCVCREETPTALEQNVNQMVFVNKSKRAVTALLIIPTYEGESRKLLGFNRFRLQVTGRWKKTKEEREAESANVEEVSP